MLSQEEIEYRNKLMRKAGRIAADILQKVCSEAVAGISLIELDDLAERLCYQNDVLPAFKGYLDFPNTLCVGVNDVVVHGIPDEYVLKDGDVVSLDFGIKYKKVMSDTAYTVIIGNASEDVKKFIKTVEESLYKGIKQAIPGNHVGDIGYAIQQTVEAKNYNVVREMVGHGVGYALHEEPYIPGYGKKGQDMKLYDGQTLAIEAIINKGGKEIFTEDDGWTTKTQDGELSALFEHTIIVGEEPEILTRWE